MVYTPPSDGSRWQGLAALCWLVLTDAIILAWVALKPVGWSSFLLLLVFAVTLPVLVHLTVRTWGAFNLEYWLDRNALRVRWGGTRQVIPRHSIRRIVEGVDEMSSRPSLLDWPSPFVRIVEGGQGRRLVRLASVPLDQCLLIETDNGIFAISPEDPVDFLEELQALNRLGLARTLPLVREQPTNYYALATESAAGRWLLLAGLIGLPRPLRLSHDPLPGFAGSARVSLQSTRCAGQHQAQERTLSASCHRPPDILDQYDCRPVDETARSAFRRLPVLDWFAACASPIASGAPEPDHMNRVGILCSEKLRQFNCKQDF